MDFCGFFTANYRRGLTMYIDQPNNVINIHPHSGWFFIFGHSPNRYWRHTSVLFIGLPAMQLILATRKRVVIKAFLREEGGTPLYQYTTSFFLWRCDGRSLRNVTVCTNSNVTLSPSVSFADSSLRREPLSQSFCAISSFAFYSSA